MEEASNIVQGMVEEGQEVPLELQAELHQVPRAAVSATGAVQTPLAVAEEFQAPTPIVDEPQVQEPKIQTLKLLPQTLIQNVGHRGRCLHPKL